MKENANKKQEARLNNIIDTITAIARLDFSKKLEVEGQTDLLDIVGIGINMLSEALEDTVVSKHHLEESKKKYKMLFSKAGDAILYLG